MARLSWFAERILDAEFSALTVCDLLVGVTRRTAEGKTKRDIIRCLKPYVIREVYHLVKTNPRTSEMTS